MALNDGLEALGRVLELAKHGILDIAVADDVRVTLVSSLSIRSASFLLKAWLIEVDFFGHDDCLCGHQHLQDGTDLRIPVLCRLTLPCAEQR